MDFLQYKETAFKAALERGCDAAEVYFNDRKEFAVNIAAGELDMYTVEHEYGVNLRVQLDGKNGYAYTEVMDDPVALVERAMDNARAIESKDLHPMQGKCDYVDVVPPKNSTLSMTAEEKIAYAKELEKATLSADPRVKRTDRSSISTSSRITRIHNTLGLTADKSEESSFAVLSPILEQDGVEKDSFAVREGEALLNIDSIVNEAIEKAARQFGAAPVPSGEYGVILLNRAMANMLTAFAPMFSADAAQKGLSLLNGKEGEIIASSLVTIMDDPLFAENPRAFDDEGTPSVTKVVVENGALKTLLHNLKTAMKAGVASTSNAGRGGAADSIGVSPSNFYIVAGDKSYDGLVEQLGNGLVITEVGGLHSGLNTVSGDFSLIAKGLLIENGKVVRPVEQVTVAGNFLTLMKGIVAIGSDLRFSIPSDGRVGSPSVLVDGIMVSGS